MQCGIYESLQIETIQRDVHVNTGGLLDDLGTCLRLRDRMSDGFSPKQVAVLSELKAIATTTTQLYVWIIIYVNRLTSCCPPASSLHRSEVTAWSPNHSCRLVFSCGVAVVDILSLSSQLFPNIAAPVVTTLLV